MHIVYKLTFKNRIVNNQYPNSYIGSKSNCTFDGTTIFDKKGKPYYGSSNCKLFKEAIEQETPDVEILFSTDDYNNVLSAEREAHISNDVVISPNYFNKAIALESTYHNPDYTTMRNVISGKVCRIPRNHPAIKSGEWVGVSAGKSWYNNGETNKTFNDGKAPQGWKKGRIGDFDYSKRNLELTRGVHQKGVETRIKNGSYIGLNKGLKRTPYNCITNGVEERHLKLGEEMPEGWRFGKRDNIVGTSLYRYTCPLGTFDNIADIQHIYKVTRANIASIYSRPNKKIGRKSISTYNLSADMLGKTFEEAGFSKLRIR